MKKLLKRKVLLRTPIFTVTDNYLQGPQGRAIRRISIEHGGSTVVMPVDPKLGILLVRQYRFAVRRYLWELPAGMVDPGESALQAAKRELLEETGYRAKRWRKLISFYPSPGFQEEKMTIFLAQDFTAGKAAPTHDEFIEWRWFEPAWVETQIRNGRICDAKTIIGFKMWQCLCQAAPAPGPNGKPISRPEMALR